MSKLKPNITMPLDGYVAGRDQSTRHPLGIGGEQLHVTKAMIRVLAYEQEPWRPHAM